MGNDTIDTSKGAPSKPLSGNGGPAPVSDRKVNDMPAGMVRGGTPPPPGPVDRVPAPPNPTPKPTDRPPASNPAPSQPPSDGK